MPLCRSVSRRTWLIVCFDMLLSFKQKHGTVTILRMASLRDEKNLRKVRRLRARGLTFQAIADRFGLTRQAVHYALNGIPRAVEIRCSRCSRTIRRQDNWLHILPVLCVSCIDRQPTTFAERLRALRVEAGITAKELGKLAGINAATITLAERGLHKQTRRTVAKLAAVLGPKLTQK